MYYDLHLGVVGERCSRSDGTVWKPWQVPFPKQASRSELIPSQAQLSTQLGLLHVRLPQLEFTAEKPVVTVEKPVVTNWQASIQNSRSKYYKVA